MEGLVVKSTGSWYEVETSQKERIQARLKGKFRIKGLKSTNPLAVGDRVKFEMEGEEGVIHTIEDRKNYIIRKSINLSKQVQIIAANVDCLFLIITIENPVTTLGFVDRFLVGAEAYRIPTVLVYNKLDLLTTEKQEKDLARWKEIYKSAGYEQLEVVATEEKGIDKLKELMKGKISIFSGNSGVGKSTLINSLDSNFDLRVNKISDAHQTGQHTTTFAELFELPFGGKIIDTPGIKGFGNVELDREVLSHYFPEMREKINDCKFNNCVHINEPNCAIKEAVAKGEIAKTRYLNYLSIFEEEEGESYRTKGY
ncbi:MAG: ribosome small subunit-dependent GTPase A [Vicingaceae bacterium]